MGGRADRIVRTREAAFVISVSAGVGVLLLSVLLALLHVLEFGIS